MKYMYFYSNALFFKIFIKLGKQSEIGWFIFRKALQSMCVAYSSKNLCVPAVYIKELLLYNSIEDVFAESEHFGITCDIDSETVKFLKGCFNDKANVSTILYIFQF